MATKKAPAKLASKPFVADPLYAAKLGKQKGMNMTPSAPKVKNSGVTKA